MRQGSLRVLPNRLRNAAHSVTGPTEGLRTRHLPRLKKLFPCAVETRKRWHHSAVWFLQLSIRLIASARPASRNASSKEDKGSWDPKLAAAGSSHRPSPGASATDIPAAKSERPSSSRTSLSSPCSHSSPCHSQKDLLQRLQHCALSPKARPFQINNSRGSMESICNWDVNDQVHMPASVYACCRPCT